MDEYSGSTENGRHAISSPMRTIVSLYSRSRGSLMICSFISAVFRNPFGIASRFAL